MLSRPKEGSMGTGTGGYTSGLGTFKDHLGYGSSLFGEGGINGGKSSGMVSPDAAAGQIASKSFGMYVVFHGERLRFVNFYQLGCTPKANILPV